MDSAERYLRHEPQVLVESEQIGQGVSSGMNMGRITTSSAGASRATLRHDGSVVLSLAPSAMIMDCVTALSAGTNRA